MKTFPCLHLSKQGKHLAAVFFFCTCFNNMVSAQRLVDYAVHANIIYHFTKYIDWPESRKNGDFIIGILGDSPLYDELTKTVQRKSANGRRIIIKHISLSEDLAGCHIIFIPTEESLAIRKLVSKTARLSVLLVAEDDGMANRGAAINFVIVGDRLRLEINKESIEMHQLNIASELLRLGKLVNHQ